VGTFEEDDKQRRRWRRRVASKVFLAMGTTQ
jgi:hypothetical protein